MREKHRDIRAKVRDDLPAEAFRRDPQCALWVIPLVSLILIGSVLISTLQLPWYIDLVLSFFVANGYGSLAFLAHEIGHGACVRSRRLQNLCLYLGFGIFCVSPHLWRVWHNQVHHPHANIEGYDTDTTGSLENVQQFSSTKRYLLRFAPGSGHPLSIINLFIFFTFHGQDVLWSKSKLAPGFEHLQRKRAIVDSLLLILFWTTLCVFGGPKVTLFVVVIPMLLANFLVMSYIFTNHLLRPLVHTQDPLSSTMSVTTLKIIDLIHFNFSYHVEHHLFPGMSARYYPLVRQSLLRHAKESYLAPPHWWAVCVLFKTPRVYADSQTLIEPNSGRKVTMVEVETLLAEVTS